VVDPNETEEFESIKFDFMACLFGVWKDKEGGMAEKRVRSDGGK
jgi:hypothetical protein